jgi:hypothetical protein
MKLLYLLFSLVNCTKIIKNINIPSCKNCVYYKPNIFDSDYTSSFSKCTKFGEKNIVTDVVQYNFADSCRNDEARCGYEGKYFEEEKNINRKILIFTITRPFFFFAFLYFLLIFRFIFTK